MNQCDKARSIAAVKQSQEVCFCVYESDKREADTLKRC